MKIENVSKVVELDEERKELEHALCLVQGGGDICTYSAYGDHKKHIRDIGIRNKLAQAIIERLKDIDEEIKIL